MSFPATILTYSEGAEEGKATVMMLAELLEGELHVITDVTPFHPLDPWWPDQPSDRGVIVYADMQVPVVRADLVGWNSGLGEMRLNADRAVKRANPDWAWGVGHVVAKASVGNLTVGSKVLLKVDSRYRRAIAVGHTACHIAALALNSVLNQYWTKDIRCDSLGHRNFDQSAILVSKVAEYYSTDQYRLGKSLRKSGFSADAFWSDFEHLPAKLTQTANHLLDGISEVRVIPPGTNFHERRTWVANYEGRELTIPCGGVHIADVRLIRAMSIELTRTPSNDEFEMHTTVAGSAS